ncbi:unnamed protein product, partial [marine sediment metagenome]
VGVECVLSAIPMVDIEIGDQNPGDLRSTS